MTKQSLFKDAIWHALHSKHRHLGAFAGQACRYQKDVAPFAAVAEPAADAFRQLCSLLEPDEAVWLMCEDDPQLPELRSIDRLTCLQMELPESADWPSPTVEVERLSGGNAPEMVALTTLAFPGFFHARTHLMGAYYGVRSSSGELIAMAGERLMLDGYSEISGVCTHPAHRGKGLASKLIGRLVQDHRREGLVSWLHVAESNRRAIELYQRLGFVQIGKVALHRIVRAA